MNTLTPSQRNMNFWQHASDFDLAVFSLQVTMINSGMEIDKEDMLETIDKLLESERKIGEIEL